MLLTAAEFRELVQTELGDNALNLLLDAAEAEIDAYAGAVNTASELFGGVSFSRVGRFLDLARPATSITSITETIGWGPARTLDPTDFLLRPDGYTIERRWDGVSPAWTWGARVLITYVPVDDTARRKVAQAQLVQLAIEYHPGVASETIGSWTQQYRQAIAERGRERDDILLTLSTGSGMVVVG